MDSLSSFRTRGILSWAETVRRGIITKIDVDNLDANGNPAVENIYLPADFMEGRTYDIAYNAEQEAFYAVEPPSKFGEAGTIHIIDVSNFDGTGVPAITPLAR